MDYDEDVNNNDGDDSEVSNIIASMPIENAAMQAHGVDFQPSWTPNGNTGALPQYQENPNIEYMNQNHDATETPAPVHNPIYSADVDLAGFLRAQVAFNTEQTMFLEQGRALKNDDYVRALARFSRSQSALIRAHNVLLSQLGVL